MYTFERTAKYYETDQMGIVHHSNYIRWFEEARIELMNYVGLPYRQMEENGILIPVLGVTCNYKHPIRFDETIVLELKIRNYNGVRFEVVYTRAAEGNRAFELHRCFPALLYNPGAEADPTEAAFPGLARGFRARSGGSVK